MRIVWLLPVTYVAGIDGFSWFIPYLALVGAVAGVARVMKKRPRVSGGVEDSLQLGSLELEPAAG